MAKSKKTKFDANAEFKTLVAAFLKKADSAGKTLEDVVAELGGGSVESDFDRDSYIKELSELKIKGLTKAKLKKKDDEELAELYAEHVNAGSDGSSSDSDGSDSDSSNSDSDSSGSDSDGSESDGSESDGSGSDSDGSESDGSESDGSGSDSDGSESDGSGSDSSNSDSDGSGSDDSDEVSIEDMRKFLIDNKIEKKAKVKKMDDDEVEELYEQHAAGESDGSESDESGSWESNSDDD